MSSRSSLLALSLSSPPSPFLSCSACFRHGQLKCIQYALPLHPASKARFGTNQSDELGYLRPR
eukprot:3114809-Pleurochrysis_carterae.AAC.1